MLIELVLLGLMSNLDDNNYNIRIKAKEDIQRIVTQRDSVKLLRKHKDFGSLESRNTISQIINEYAEPSRFMEESDKYYRMRAYFYADIYQTSAYRLVQELDHDMWRYVSQQQYMRREMPLLFEDIDDYKEYQYLMTNTFIKHLILDDGYSRADIAKMIKRVQE